MNTTLAISLALLVPLLVLLWSMGQSSWHLDRNKLNALPTGKLTLKQDNLYHDEAGRSWVLLPARMNAFHQPNGPVPTPAKPYGAAVSNVDYDPNNPNLKFLSVTKDGGSLEAILQPDGTYLTSGPQQGTYNYGHPTGFRGMLKHALWDVLPHLMNGNYR
jgi:hypothetical protein